MDIILELLKNPIRIILAFVIFALIVAFIRVCYERAKYNAYLNSDIGKIDNMSGAEFEEYLYNKFKSFGYEVEMTPGSHDFGADLILTMEDGFRIAIQAKRYEEKVSLPAVQEVVASLKYYGCDKGMVVTNSEYTDNARELARVNEVILWDRQDIINEMIENEGANWE